MVMGKVASTKENRYVVWLTGAMRMRFINSVFLSPDICIATKSALKQ